MKRISISIGIIGLLACQIMAGPLSQEVVIERAQAWMGSNVLMKQSPRSIGSVTRFPETNSTYFVYVVTLSPSGYLILNSDDRLPLIFSFSAQSPLDLSDKPQNTLRFLLEKHIKTVTEGGGTQPKGVKSKSGEPLALSEYIAPLLETAWAQKTPYNWQCPTNSTGELAPSGCVATAYAQAINYHAWPPHGFGQSTYRDQSGSLQGRHSVDCSDPYDWASMLNYYTASNFSDASGNAVAELMYEVGVLGELNYEDSETAGNFSRLLRPLFQHLYYELGIPAALVNDLTDRLDMELRAGFPVPIGIPFHAIVADGLMTDSGVTTYHLNYGWGGVNNGWFDLDAVSVSYGITHVRPALLAFSTTNEVNAISNQSTMLNLKIPNRRKDEVHKLGVYEETKQPGIWSSDASAFSKTPYGWVIDPNGRSGDCWYAYDDCSMVLRESFVPDSSSELSFWMHLNIAFTEFDISVSTDGGESFSSIALWTGNNVTAWRKKTISLAAFAGQRIQLRFELIDESYYSGAKGVWLDDLSISSADWYDWDLLHETTSFSIDQYSETETLLFDGTTFDGLTLEPSSGADAWQISQTNGVESCFSKVPMPMATMTTQNPITPTSDTLLKLHARYKLAWDGFQISVSTDQVNFTEIYKVGIGYGVDMPWGDLLMDLSSYAGQPIYLQFKYIATGAGASWKDGGIWIDSISTVDRINSELKGQPIHSITLPGISTGTHRLAVAVTDQNSVRHDFSPAFNLLVENAGANVPPVVSDSLFSVVENSSVGTAVGTVSASDPGDTLSFAITAGNADGKFAIHSATGEITLTGSIDYETVSSYGLTVTVTDSISQTDTASISISITDIPNDDSDSDGLTDEWEVANFTTVAAQIGSGDADSDGATNSQEEHFGTDPNNASDSPNAEYIGLHTWWKFNDAAGTVAIDSSGNGNNGTITGATWVDGVEAGALSFDGSNDKVLKLLTESTWAEFSLALWVKAETLGQNEYSSIFNNNSGGNDFQIDVDGGTPGNYRYKGGTTASMGPVVLEWVHLSVCCDGTDTKIYKNGELVSSLAGCSDTVFGRLALGVNRSGNKYFNGVVDDLRLYTRSLTDAEIVALYQQNNTAPNQAPSVQNASFAVTENSAISTVVGTVSASDPDTGDALAFSITAGNANGAFAIDSVSGEITVAGSIDYETLTSYSLTVSVTDGALSDTATISISVTDVPNDDSDADGLTDEWEVANFTTVAAQIGSGDADSDGISNQREENLGSNPNDAAVPGAEYENLCGWWKLNDLSGVTALDSSGNGNDGSLSGGSWVGGVEAGALDFVAANQDSVEIPSAAFASIDTEVTFSVWVYGDAAVQPQQNAVLRASDASGNRVLTTHLPWDSKIYWDAGNSGSSYDRIDKSATLSEFAGQWNHWVFTKNATTGDMTIYLNGQLWHSGTGKTHSMSGVVTAHIGSVGGTGSFYDGSLDDIRLYNRVLTDAEIRTLYQQNNNTPNQAPSVQNASFAVTENSAISTVVGTVSASDPDAGDTLAFSITAGNSNGAFAIDSVSGGITVAGSIDYETLTSYSLTVSVTDGALSDTATISISVTDVPNDDSDADGLTDEWEVANFTTVAAQIGSGDADSDGISNQREENLGSNPNDAAVPGSEYENLCGWWTLDETSGTVAADSSGNRLDASNANGVLVNQSGHINGAFGFDGIDDSSATQGTTAPGSDLTITAWIRPSNISGAQAILSKNSSFTFKLNGSSIRFTTPGHRDHFGSSGFVANDWQFVAVTFTPSTTGGCRFYRNGAFLNAVNSSVIDQNSNSLLLGNNQWNERFAGGLDDIRLYDRILTDTEINALYQQNSGVYNLWKDTQFTAAELADPAISGDDADIDADQLSNLIEYALGLDPKTHSGSMAGCAIELNGVNGWKVEFNRHASHNDIDLGLEWTAELNPANWQPVAESIAGGAVQPLNGTTLVSETGSEPTVVELNVPSTVPHGFIRWKVDRK